MVSDFLRRILSFIGFSDRADSESVQKLVHLNGLNRRKNLRVNYSHLGPTGPFPRVKYKGDEVIIANISVGGLLIIDDVGRFGDQVGEMIELELQWPDFSTRMR